MSNLKKWIVVLTIILIILILTLVYVIIQNKRKTIEEIDEQGRDITYDIDTTIKPVSVRNNFYIVKECVNRFYSYYMAVFDIEENYYNANETLKQEAQKQNAEAIYDMLDSKYISEKAITKDNILTKLEKIKSSTVNITNMYVSEKTTNMSVYIVQGTLINNTTKEISQFQMIVKVDSLNRTFSIIPQDYVKENYNNLQVGGNIDIEVQENIEKNTNNKYIFNPISDQTYVTDLFNQYKNEALYTPKLAYNKLDEEYRNKRFGTLQKFEEYIKSNSKKYATLRIVKYQKTVTDNYIQYVCIDNNGNYYIFKENSVMNCTLILDTYTIDLPEFIQKYNNVEENEKILLNIQKIFEAINSGDYQYVYGKLDSTFKSKYFTTLEQFEKYIKENWYSYNKISYEKYQKNGDIYLYNIQITDGENTKVEKINKKIVMKLLEGTDFVMSFNVE